MFAYDRRIHLLGSVSCYPFVSRAFHKHQPISLSFELVGFSVSVLVSDRQWREVPVRGGIDGPSASGLGFLFPGQG